MTLPRGFWFTGWLLFVAAPAQLYLFTRVRCWVAKRLSDARLRTLALFLSGCLFALPVVPLLWRFLLGGHPAQAHPSLFRDLFSISSIWWAGSIGCALMLGGYNLFERLNLSSKRNSAERPADLGRRNFLRNSVGAAAAAPFMLSGYGVLVERRRFKLEHFEVRVSGLSAALDHFTIAQLTDIHVGPFMPPEELAVYVEAVNRLNPDIVALTGDFITGSQNEVAPCVDTLAALKARYGVYACLGNHDTFAGAADKLTRLLDQHGIQTLRNDSATVEVGNSKVAILGIDDLVRGRPDLLRARSVAEKNPGEANILLSHRPEIFPTAARQGMDLVLSGHYHGGQIKLFPEPDGLSIARFLTPYAEGFFQLPRSAALAPQNRRTSTLFVGRGVGITALPIRINCPPQIAHLTLTRA